MKTVILCIIFKTDEIVNILMTECATAKLPRLRKSQFVFISNLCKIFYISILSP